MGIFKTLTLSTLLAASLFAKVDFNSFGDICDQKQKCQNRRNEILAMQYLLKKRFNEEIKLTGKWDEQTKANIIAFQKQNGIPATGYVGTKTKTALNYLLYGDKKMKSETKLKSKKSVVIKTKPKKVKKQLSSNKETNSTKVATKKGRVDFSSYSAFRRSVDLKKSFAIYKDPKLLRIAKRAKTHIKVDVSEQRIKLFVNGKVALDAPCTTGARRKLEPNTRTIRDKHTPYGTFRIMEKIAVKRSTIFGDIYRNGKLVYHGDRRKYRGSWKGAKFVGHPLKKWMRLTSSGIGFHASNAIKRYPASNGCIRLPHSVANTLFASIKKGTKVKVVY